MALRTLGTNATTSLNCLTSWSQVLSAADVAAITQSISSDENFGLILDQQGFAPGAKGILATGSTHSNATLDTLVSTGGGPLSSILVGDLVLGVGITPGTFVQAIASSTSVTLSQAATASASIRVAFLRVSGALKTGLSLYDQRLVIPNRGTLKILPGDIVAIDNIGWPILVSGAAIAYGGSLWTLT